MPLPDEEDSPNEDDDEEHDDDNPDDDDDHPHDEDEEEQDDEAILAQLEAEAAAQNVFDQNGEGDESSDGADNEQIR
jgi:hypothetical protein